MPTCHYPESHMTTNIENKAKTKVVSIARGNSVEAYKLISYSLRRFIMMNSASFQCYQRDIQLVTNLKIIWWSDRTTKVNSEFGK